MRTPMRRALRHAAIAAFCLHGAVALLASWTWSRFGRGNLLVGMDFPVSLFFLGQTGGRLVLASLLLGGLQWAAFGAFLAWIVGRSVRPPE